MFLNDKDGQQKNKSQIILTQMIPVIYWTGQALDKWTRPEAGRTADMTDKQTIIKTVKKAPLLFFWLKVIKWCINYLLRE